MLGPLTGMIGGCLIAWAIVAAIAGSLATDVALGMAAPLLASVGTWVMVVRTIRATPERLTARMVGAFGIKAVLLGGFVALAIRGLGVQPIPFVVSFTSSFVALLFVEAWLLRRLLLR